jgi:hypothetical protein
MNKFIMPYLCAVGLLSCVTSHSMPTAKVTIEVVDEAGRPVPDAKVGISFWGAGEGRVLTTDREGRVVESSKTHGSAGGAVTKDGFYKTTFQFSLFDHVPKGVTVGRRYPDVTHRVVIRPKLKPVPMYAYQFSRAIPVEGEEIGIDLLKADWVAPHGKGEVADVIIHFVTAPYSGPSGLYGALMWKFPGDGNGMARVSLEDCHEKSDFRMPRHAPLNGYIPEWRHSRTRVGETRASETQPTGLAFDRVPYFFRIRCRFDDRGQIRDALYGKIILANGSIGWNSATRSKANISFTYHVNPDGTRNLEFDPERNLFTDPPWDRHNFPRQP